MKTRDDILALIEQIRGINSNDNTPIRQQTRGDVVEWLCDQLEMDAPDFAMLWRVADDAMDCHHHNRPWSPARAVLGACMEDLAELDREPGTPVTLTEAIEANKPQPQPAPAAEISPRTGKPKRKYTRRKKPRRAAK